MNRNVESHFAELPSIDIERSIFDRSSSHKTSFNVGELIPFYVDEVLPGDTFKVTTSIVARLQTLLTPIMDNIYLDTYFFFVPNRIVYNKWKNFMGESESAWTPTQTYSVPQIKFPENGFATGTIADYMGVPVNVHPTDDWMTINAMPFRGYAMICDQWFRDQNLSQPLQIPLDETTVTGVNSGNQVTDIAKGGLPFKVAKYHDYFTSCLPGPQKADAVTIFGDRYNVTDQRYIPVVTGIDQYLGQALPEGVPALFGHYYDAGEVETSNYVRVTGIANQVQALAVSDQTTRKFVPTNLWADYGQMVVTINQLRLSFQLQKFYEKCARGGTRYRELIKAHFGVTSPDARMMIPEYLGGTRIPISIHQVANQSQGENDFLGDVAAMSNTSDVHEDFIKSFTEHGFVIGVCCARYDHTYAQGLERFWTRKDQLNYYFPVFANLGEQPVYKYEINLTAAEPQEKTFGYNEAWSEYRYKPSRVSGEMRPNITGNLSHWHLADNYDSEVTLSDDWIREDKTNVDRVLAVTSSVANQIFADIYVKNIATRPMPMYSIPGLIDHH